MTERKPRPLSSGEIISSFAFAVAALWLADQALEAQGVRTLALWICAAACMAGAARHPIARLMRDRG